MIKAKNKISFQQELTDGNDDDDDKIPQQCDIL